jgi:hypothetical protein
VAGIALALGASATLVTVGGAVVVFAAFTVTMWRDTR